MKMWSDISKVKLIAVIKSRIGINYIFYFEQGLPYRIYVLRFGQKVDQLVVPKKYRSLILGLSYDVKLAGHE